MTRLRTIVITVAAIVSSASPAHANTGIPMIVVAWPMAWLLFPFVVGIEAAIGARMMTIPVRRALSISTRANAYSTVAGLPAVWLKTFLVQFALSLVLIVPYLVLRETGHLPPPTLSSDARTPGFGSTLLRSIFTCAWVTPTRYNPVMELALALLVLCVPFYLVSVRLETSVARRYFDEERAGEVHRWMKAAHRVSYGLIAILLLIAALWTA